ncbi:MAG TPA: NAD-dependent formate dehydrogenase, partial [Rhodopila sp.]
CDADAVAEALASGQLAGFATDTDVPSPSSGPTSHAAGAAMPAHAAGATLSAQARYAAGVREVLECWFAGEPIRARYLIIDRGEPTAVGARSYGLAAPSGAASPRRIKTR